MDRLVECCAGSSGMCSKGQDRWRSTVWISSKSYGSDDCRRGLGRTDARAQPMALRQDAALGLIRAI